MLWDVIYDIGYYVVLMSGVAIVAIFAYKEGCDDRDKICKAEKEDHNDR